MPKAWRDSDGRLGLGFYRAVVWAEVGLLWLVALGLCAAALGPGPWRAVASWAAGLDWRRESFAAASYVASIGSTWLLGGSAGRPGRARAGFAVGLASNLAWVAFGWWLGLWSMVGFSALWGLANLRGLLDCRAPR